MKILLVCSSGMTTSLLVNKMIDASLAMGNNDKIWAVGQNELDKSIAESDVLLLSPQMKFLFNKIEDKCKKHDVLIGEIPTNFYNKIDGESILNFAYKVAGN